MLRHSQGGQRQDSAWWLRTLALLCVMLLTVAGAVQASHGHDAGPVRDGQRAVLLAPAQDCAWCAAAQVALPATAEQVVARLPWSAPVLPKLVHVDVREPWNAEMFGRPPPRERRMWTAGGEWRRGVPVSRRVATA